MELDKKYIACWSGGKDSTFMVDELLRKSYPLDEVIFCDTGYEFDIMYEYIEKIKEYWQSKYNIKITLLNYGKGKDIWESWSETQFTKGQYKGSIRGFPFHLGMSWCTRELKVNPVKKYIKQNYKSFNVVEYIGIAVDEPNRIKENGEVYPMVEWGVTEKEATMILIDRGLHNPLYNHFHRTGCFLCPKQSLSSLYKLWKHYDKEFSTIQKMQEHYKKNKAGVWKFKGYTVEELIVKFKAYEKKGKPTNYLDEEQPLGCMCK